MQMTDLEKSVIQFYINKHKEDVKKINRLERDLNAMTDLYREKTKEVERAEVIIEILFNRLENKNKILNQLQ